MMENFVAIDIEDEIMEQEASTSNVDTYANYTAGILKGMGNMSTINRVLREDDAVFVKKNALRLSRRHQS